MRIRTRLIVFACFTVALVAAGRLATGGLAFIAREFWFNAGMLMLLLGALIEQPFFSKDADILVDGLGGGLALLTVAPAHRSASWVLFLCYCVYLVASSYTLLWLRSRPLRLENTLMQLVSRLNRRIGRPQVLFSALFLWGIAGQMGVASSAFFVLLVYWGAFMVFDTAGLGEFLEGVLVHRSPSPSVVGEVVAVLHPGVILAETHQNVESLLGKQVQLGPAADAEVAMAQVVDDRRLHNRRLTTAVVCGAASERWDAVVGSADRPICVYVSDPQPTANTYADCVGVVEANTDLQGLCTSVPAHAALTSGQLVAVAQSSGTPAHYQVTGARVADVDVGHGEVVLVVRVSAQQLGVWNEQRARFDALTWVPSPGAPVRTVQPEIRGEWPEVRNGQLLAGFVPQSSFPVYVSGDEMVTLNTAILGVTGCGKSYLAFRLIEHMLEAGMKVLVLDVSRQHGVFLTRHGPRELRDLSGDLSDWIGEQNRGLAIYEFEGPRRPTEMTEHAAATILDHFGRSPLQTDRDYPARLCVVFEEAHSLIPEWNQCDRTDQEWVNKTARRLLQFRKYGLGYIVIAQRTANVTKTILNQCSTIFGMQCFDETGFDFLGNYMGEQYARALPTLPQRHAVLVGKASATTRPIIVEIPDMSDRWDSERTTAESVHEQAATAERRGDF